MTAVKLSPFGNTNLIYPTTGIATQVCQLFFYEANTSTKLNTYTTSAGSVANANPIVTDAYGACPNQVWLIEGQQYKVVIAASDDTDPPTSGIVLGDYISGINDNGIVSGIDQWISSGLTPTYVSGTSFTFSTDQTTIFHVGRRIKTTNTGGTIYSTITASSYAAHNTTITVVNDSGTLDSGLSVVNYAVLSSVNPSIPKIALPDGSTATTQTAGDSTTKLATTAFVTGAGTTNKHNSVQDFRLTLTTAVPVTTNDVTGATTVYCTPYTGNKIGLYNGATWDIVTSAEFSVALGTITSDQGYDVFCYNNAGVATLELLAWTSNTARATALIMQDGILCKSGQLTRRYLGSFLTTSTTQTEDSEAKRYLFNYYHRAPKSMKVIDATASWAGSATWQESRAVTTNRLQMFIGVVDQRIKCFVNCAYSNSGTARTEATIGFGLNVTNAATGMTSSCLNPASNTDKASGAVAENILPILGKNFISRVEITSVAANSLFYGTSGNTVTGINGVIDC